MKNLVRIQRELKAPKDKENKFGNYRYRSAESILEAVKPLLHDCLLTLEDEVVNIGERYYIKATARFVDPEQKSLTEGMFSIEVSAYAREALDRKGMDDSQLTGACSSYARKYALGGLFLIDDGNDADSMKPTDEKPSKPALMPSMTAKWHNAVKALREGKTFDDIEKVYTLTDETRKQLANDML